MHLEFRAALNQAVSAVLAAECAGGGDEPLRFSVCDAPAEIDALLASNAAFEMSSRLRRIGLERRPRELAEAVLARLRAGPAARYFDISLGGEGYLNAVPLPQFTSDFLGALHRRPDALLDPRPLLVQRNPEGGGAAGREEFDILLDLENIRRALERRERGDALELYAGLRKGSAVLHDVLMLAAVCADPELDLGAYISGAQSSESLPWFFARLQFDAQRYLSALSAHSDIGKTGTALAGTVPEYAEQAFMAAAGFRGHLTLGEGRTNAVRLAGGLLNLARGFYAFFNRPDCRMPARLPVQAALSYGILARTTAATLERGLALLGNSCEQAGLVLEK